MKKTLLVLCNLLVCMALFAQSPGRVSGVVSAANGGGTLTASVVVKGSGQGASTDANGRYAIENVPTGSVLVISAVGYQSQEIAVNGRSVINVSLETDAQSLDEVIMVAYGTATRGTFTGSASAISQKEIKDQPVVSFQNALIGKIPGVQVTSSSGQAGATSNIRIRGIGSMNASNEPLYVIDGVPVVSGNSGQLSDYIYSTSDVMSTLNPADIESITVLKDAAASSLYGSRAANGVVLITTKKGKAGRPQISFKSSIGFTPEWATDNYETAGPQEQVDMLYRIFHDYRKTYFRENSCT